MALALSGWWLSFELTARSFGQRTSGLSAMLCSAKSDSKQDDCHAVQNSPWGTFPISGREGAPRMPVGVLGMGYFAAVALWLLFVGQATRDRWYWHAGLLAICVISAIYSVDFLRVMSVILKQWCAACVGVHAINFALLVSVLLLLPARRGFAGSPSNPATPLALAAITSGVLVFSLQIVYFAARLTDMSYKPMQDAYLKISRDPAFARWHFQRQPDVAVPLDRDAAGESTSDQFEGPADAQNTLVVFSDFQCSACLRVHAIVDKLLRESPGRLRVLYRHYPLNPACNPEAERALHPAACGAAKAAIAAQAVGGNAAAAKMRRLFFERQGALGNADFVAWAGELGLDRATYRTALESPEIERLLATDIALAKSAGVSNTPTLFLNGKRFDHWTNAATWEALIGGAAASVSGEAIP